MLFTIVYCFVTVDGNVLISPHNIVEGMSIEDSTIVTSEHSDSQQQPVDVSTVVQTIGGSCDPVVTLSSQPQSVAVLRDEETKIVLSTANEEETEAISSPPPSNVVTTPSLPEYKRIWSWDDSAPVTMTRLPPPPARRAVTCLNRPPAHRQQEQFDVSVLRHGGGNYHSVSLRHLNHDGPLPPSE